MGLDSTLKLALLLDDAAGAGEGGPSRGSGSWSLHRGARLLAQDWSSTAWPSFG